MKYVKHGDVGTRLHNVWRGMKTRTSSYGIDRHRYFERGITVCEEWQQYTKFRDWALSNGFQEHLQIDRIDNSKGYYPENCHFVTGQENINNRDFTMKVEYNGEILPLMPILKEKGLEDKYWTIRGRLKRGWIAQEAIDTPIRQGNYRRKCG